MVHQPVVPACSRAGSRLRRLSDSRRWLAVGVLAASLFLGLPAAVDAAEFRAGEEVRVPVGEIVEGDLYAAGESIVIEGTVNGDLVAAGATIRVSGPVRGSLTLAGGTITISRPVEGSARLAAGDVQIASQIRGDVLAAGSEVAVTPNGRLGHDLVGFGTTVRVDGEVAGSVRGAAERLLINGAVGRDVSATTTQLEIGGQAQIEGDVTYESANEAAVAPGATIRGRVERREPPRDERREPGPYDWVGGFLLRWLMPLVFGALIVLLWPTSAVRAAQALRREPLVVVAFGALALVVTPIVALVLMVTVVGIPAALALLALYAIALYATQVVIGLALGQLVVARLVSPWTPSRAALLGALTFGLLVLAIVHTLPVPVLGPVVTLLTLLLGLGALWSGFIRVQPEPPAAAA